MIKEGKHPNTSEGRKAAAGECYGVYDNWKKKSMANMEPFVFQNNDNSFDHFEETDDEYIVKGAVLMKGDIFYQGDFVPWSVIKSAANYAAKTQIHDLNHQGTGYPMPNGQMVPSDVNFIVGYQTNLHVDDKNKALYMDVHINKDAPMAKTWKNYYDVCERAGRMPNVSAFGYKRVSFVKAKDLPIDCAAFGLKGNETIASLNYMDIQAGSTVYRGACNDQDGCGMPIKCDEEQPCEDFIQDEPIDEVRLSYLKKRINILGGTNNE